MDLDFHPQQWVGVFQSYPVLIPLFGGLLAGCAAAQLVKMTWFGFGDTSKITEARYRASMYWLATVFTFFMTYELWRVILPAGAHGLERVSSIAVGLSSPLAYRLVKALVGWKFPTFAAAWGDNGGRKFKPA